ncbi:MAG: HlyD family efflux transporter periplasmic adaptor subunit [Candidatus Peribacteraceae bacterium]|nr:HlyD family efflux transporter periplasmic adaptor subunit [Candidatus Peribacteraceae bacterium]MDD5075052.1 HlyD family efflux transporter periplasmic adaptor subunit [Candidatus Peribacteraceae bacterium]
MNTTPSPVSSGQHSPASQKKAFISPERRRTIILWSSIIGIICIVGGLLYWNEERKYVYTDHAEISAPVIQLAPQAGGELKRVTVQQGETVDAFQAVARVGDEIIATHVAGVITDVQRDIGTTYRTGQKVVTMIEPQELHVVARIEEDKGLKDVRVGQEVLFTVDAFGSEEFNGIVKSISPTKREGDVVFNISDKREMQEFEVKISYDHGKYSRFQNGMSARVWIVK